MAPAAIAAPAPSTAAVGNAICTARLECFIRCTAWAIRLASSALILAAPSSYRLRGALHAPPCRLVGAEPTQTVRTVSSKMDERTYAGAGSYIAAALVLRHDLHADEIGGVHAPRRLERQDSLERGDRDGKLVETGLLRGEQLQLQAGPHDRFDPAPVAVAPGELDDLEGDARDDRHSQDARGHQQVPGRQANGAEHEDRDDHHDQQEAGAAAGVQAREALGVLRRERQSGLETGDRLVLGAVVLEHPA